MKVQIITPESVLFQGTVEWVTVPGVNGSFQMLKNHASIVSVLGKGKIRLHTLDFDINSFNLFQEKVEQLSGQDKVYYVEIKSGVIELINNEMVILAEQ